MSLMMIPFADRLKQGEKITADSCSEVTVLFADIVGFTKLSTQISPNELVILLNEIFSLFDTLADRYGLEKIKTIGDAYMVVGGLPVPRPDHALAWPLRCSIILPNSIKNMGKLFIFGLVCIADRW